VTPAFTVFESIWVGIGGRRQRDCRDVAQRLVAAFGEEFEAQPRTTRVDLGATGLCYRNASQLVMKRPDLTYAEGFAHTDGGFIVMHAWAVDAAGNVVDPTWGDRGHWYKGVRYDRQKYLQHIDRVKSYGVATNSTFKGAQRAYSGGRGRI
jgi:hypothetical protein